MIKPSIFITLCFITIVPPFDIDIVEDFSHAKSLIGYPHSVLIISASTHTIIIDGWMSNCHLLEAVGLFFQMTTISTKCASCTAIVGKIEYAIRLFQVSIDPSAIKVILLNIAQHILFGPKRNRSRNWMSVIIGITASM